MNENYSLLLPNTHTAINEIMSIRIVNPGVDFAVSSDFWAKGVGTASDTTEKALG